MDKIWRVILADDESIIREGIRESIDWSAHSIQLCGEASDGEEALELCLAHDADILLIDINMPIMNGIEVIQRLKENCSTCRTIIISGHDEFRYAQEAIRLDVTAYILKPVTPNQINQVLNELIEQLHAEQKQNQFMKLALDQIEKNTPLLTERFFMNWFREGMAEQEIKDHLSFLGLPTFVPKQIIVMKCMEVAANQLFNEKDRQLLLFSIENIVSEMLEGSRISIFRDLSDYLILICWDAILNDQIVQIEKSIESFLKIGISIKVETVQSNMLEVAECYRSAVASMTNDGLISPVAKRARQFIQTRFMDKTVTLDTVAEAINISPVYLSRLIKQELGTTFISMMTQMRIQKAVQLLNTTDKTVYEIADLCGYESQHYFSTAFKKMMGVSPNQYRKGN